MIKSILEIELVTETDKVAFTLQFFQITVFIITLANRHISTLINSAALLACDKLGHRTCTVRQFQIPNI